MKIAIASGKGGTGKTTIAVNLALSAASSGQSVTLMDCDVEEPNAHLFLKPVIAETEPVAVARPRISEERCSGCGVCADVCEYHALSVMLGRVLIFDELCHGCGACLVLCPERAIVEEGHPVGSVAWGRSGPIRFVQGQLRIGEVMSPAVIRRVKERGDGPGLCIVDSPPGTACPVVESVRGTDFVLLATEPTPFGHHDLTLAVEMVRALMIPFAVALNRSDAGNDEVLSYCRREGIEILLSLPEDRRIAERYARGEIDLAGLPGYRERFEQCLREIGARVKTGRTPADRERKGDAA